MTTRLIGFHGKAGSGKDTAFKLLEASLNIPVTRDAFADRLKLSAIRNFLPNCDLDQAYAVCEVLKSGGRVKIFLEETGDSGQEVTGREFLQHYGTEAHRDVFADDFWVSAVLPDLSDKVAFGRKDSEQWELLVITDVRFPNEAGAIRRAGGEIWKIVRPELEVGPQDAHASEIPLNGSYIDRIIINSSTIEYFEDQLLNAWNESALYV